MAAAVEAATALETALALSELATPETEGATRAAADVAGALQRTRAAFAEAERIGAALVMAASPPRVPPGAGERPGTA